MSNTETGLKLGHVSLSIELETQIGLQNGDTSATVLSLMSEAETDPQKWDTSATVLSWMSKADTDPQKGDTTAAVSNSMSAETGHSMGIHQPLY